MTFIDELEALIAPSTSCSSYTTPPFNKNIPSPPEKDLLLDTARSSDSSSSTFSTTPSPSAQIYQTNTQPYTGANGMLATLAENSNKCPKPQPLSLLEEFPAHTMPSGVLDSLNDKPSKGNISKTEPIFVQYTEKEKRERKYECEYCRKRFSRPSSLMSHIYTHTGERPFACDFPECTKRFSVLSNLRRHYRVHSNCRQRNGKKRCRGRPPAVSNQLVGHNHLGPSYFGNSNSNTMQSLDNFISTSQFLVGNTLPNSITDGVGRSRGIYYQPFNANHSTASSELLQTPLNSQALFTTKGQDYMQCSYAPSFRATAAIHPPNASLASMCNPSTNPECILGASMEAGGCVPPASQMPFTERPILYNSKPILLSAQNDFRQNGTTSPNSKYCKSLLSSLSTSPDNIVHGGASHSNDTTGGSYKADITAAQLEALFNSTSAGPGCTSNKISSISSISSRSSTSSNDGGCNDLLSASMWPFSAEGAGVTSKGMDSLETLTTVASNATNDFLTNDSCKRQQFPPGIAEDCDALSIARPAIATNNFVTTKAMNAGIHVLPESNMLDSDRTNNLFSFPQQKHGPHESNLSQFTNQQLSSTRTDKHNPTVAHIGAIGGMVLDHYVQNPMANVQDGFSDPLLRNLTKQQDSHHKYTSRGAPW